MFRKIAACGAALLIAGVTGCAGVTESASTAASTGTSTGNSAPLMITDDYTCLSSKPQEDGFPEMAKTITGTPGEQTDAVIPSVFLTVGDENTIDRDVYCPCSFQLDATNAPEYESTAVWDAQIRGRGHSTWEWPKKPYKIKLTEKVSVCGLPAAKDWVLIANYCDESLMRNTVAFAMSECLDFRFSAHAIPVNLYVNSVYQGVYTIGEQLEVKSSRLDIDDNDQDPLTGYLLEIGGADQLTDTEGVNCFSLPSGSAINILVKSPNTEKWTQEHYDYIYEYMCKADKAITTGGNYASLIDVDSFIDWFLLHELTYNADSCFHRSCYITKPRAGKLEMGPVWDFDLAFGNMYMDNPNYDDWCTVGSANSESYIGINWFNYLLADDTFRTKARARWDEIRHAVCHSQ